MSDNKTFRAILSVISFLAYVWFASWLLREGPGHGKDWMILPVIITGMALLVGTIVLCSSVEES